MPTKCLEGITWVCPPTALMWFFLSFICLFLLMRSRFVSYLAHIWEAACHTEFPTLPLPRQKPYYGCHLNISPRCVERDGNFKGSQYSSIFSWGLVVDVRTILCLAHFICSIRVVSSRCDWKAYAIRHIYIYRLGSTTTVEKGIIELRERERNMVWKECALWGLNWNWELVDHSIEYFLVFFFFYIIF